MDGELVITAGFATVYAAGSVWFYVHCVRPALLWHRSRLIARALFAVVSMLPAAVLVLPVAYPVTALVSSLALGALTAAFAAPQFATRLTGGAAPAKTGIGEVLGWLGPAGKHLDVGDLEAAQAQVDEARRHATPESAALVDHWDALVREEGQRRSGERISRYERLGAIQEEYTRLILGPDRIPPVLEALGLVAVGAAVAVSIIARALVQG